MTTQEERVKALAEENKVQCDLCGQKVFCYGEYLDTKGEVLLRVCNQCDHPGKVLDPKVTGTARLIDFVNK